ncbi:4-hydroxybenzoate octaprenyltransferase [Simiduia aestuariiviva]|uniref:4-hydroxybenzoate octaprenyltransferase n=1 Tax=Simiduia aestuariiviva TaxID=1510459 RepID=A0A839UPT6_9GAMM|nr:4-hydroxybenzoate octaprenyltransferase [Simiduia aestuariiviva]MBB3169862.1 4-hydroxybenzoate polyprenyltransferase [Simiduia aestuariiviva]
MAQASKATRARKPRPKRKVKANRWSALWTLMRFDRPIGTLLLLWPTLWALWLAAEGLPDQRTLTIFVLGVIVMRAAGCVINDYADRKVDGHVARTHQRPLVSGAVTPKAALVTFFILVLMAFGLVLLTNPFTIALSVGGLLLASVYPFMKRHTYLPQVVLGAAFAWSIPMAFAAVRNELEPGIWLVYTAVVLWTVAYDTYYAMVDRKDDLRIGVKSTAILFGESDLTIIGLLQLLALVAMLMAGTRFELGLYYYLGLLVAGALFVWQQWVARRRDPKGSFEAFLNNQWVGAAIFAGLALDLGL